MVSQTPAFPGSLYRIVTPVGDLMVVTSVAFAGICLGSRSGPAFTVEGIKESRVTASTVIWEFARNMLGKNEAYGREGKERRQEFERGKYKAQHP